MCLHGGLRSNLPVLTGSLPRLFERALETVATDYLAHQLWDKYIEFEVSQEEFGLVAKLYKRVLAIPVRDLDRYWDGFNKLLAQRPIHELMTEAEIAAFEGAEESEEAKKAAVTKARQQQLALTKEEMEKRRQFETAIKRPYFHFKPLDERQLDNWREYLDFEEAESTTSAIKLYERCLVACANYPEFWSRYANFVETNVGAAAARAIYVRMTSVFIKRRPEAFLAHALFEEGQGKAADARKIYQELIAPDAPGAGLVEAVVRFANFERRQNKLPAAIQIYKDAIAAAKDKSKNQVYLMVQLATFLSQVAKKGGEAREMYNSAMSAAPNSKGVLLSYVKFECETMEKGAEDRVSEVLCVLS